MIAYLSRSLLGNGLSHSDTFSSAQVCECFLQQSHFLLGDADGEEFQSLLSSSLSASFSPLKSTNLGSGPESGFSADLEQDFIESKMINYLYFSLILK